MFEDLEYLEISNPHFGSNYINSNKSALEINNSNKSHWFRKHISVALWTKARSYYSCNSSARRGSGLQFATFSFIFFILIYLMTPHFQRGAIHKQFSF